MQSIKSFAMSVGLGSRENQDAFIKGINVGNGVAFAVADGVGGNKGGKEASNLAVKTISKHLEGAANIDQCYSYVAGALQDFSQTNPEYNSLSTTLSLLVLSEGTGHVGHVGDSRIMHLRGDGLKTITRDQTELQELLDQGVLSKFQARNYPRRNVLLSVLGAKHKYKLYKDEFSVESKDRILLATDGFYNMVSKATLVRLSRKNTDFSKFCDEIKIVFEETQFKDDATLIAVEVP